MKKAAVEHRLFSVFYGRSVSRYTGSVEITGSNPVSSTILEKSELDSGREWGSDLLFIWKMLLGRVLANLRENTIINLMQRPHAYILFVLI